MMKYDKLCGSSSSSDISLQTGMAARRDAFPEWSFEPQTAMRFWDLVPLWKSPGYPWKPMYIYIYEYVCIYIYKYIRYVATINSRV